MNNPVSSVTRGFHLFKNEEYKRQGEYDFQDKSNATDPSVTIGTYISSHVRGVVEVVRVHRNLLDVRQEAMAAVANQQYTR